MRKILSALGVIVAAAGWNQFLFRPFTYYLDGHSFAGTLAELIKPQNAIYSGDTLLGWLFIVSSLFIVPLTLLLIATIIRSLIKYVERSETPFTVLKTHVLIEMMAQDKSKGRITRTQKFHANRTGIGAYRFNHSSEAGHVAKGDITVSTRLNGRNITKRLHKMQKASTIEVVEVFTHPMPVSVPATYLPDNLVLMLYEQFGLFDTKVAERQTITKNSNEFNSDSPMYQLTVLRNPVRNVTFDISFFETDCPRSDDVRCMVLADTAVSYREPTVSSSGDRTTYSIYVKRLLPGESLRFEWDN